MEWRHPTEKEIEETIIIVTTTITTTIIAVIVMKTTTIAMTADIHLTPTIAGCMFLAYYNVLSHIIFITTLREWFYYPNFTDEIIW